MAKIGATWTVAVVLSLMATAAIRPIQGQVDPLTQKFGYVNVKPNGFMFWWLYYTTGNPNYLEEPLIMWLQGGPGSSSCGYGNFAELGPLDIQLNPRNTTWVQTANVLFVDNPVGTGYSYVTDTGALTTDNVQIANDLVVFMKAFLQEQPEFQQVPFYIFTESYGGKMGISFAEALDQAIKNGEVTCNFKGIALGDSWISPVDSVLTWAPYLYSTSMVDEKGLTAINNSAQDVKTAFDNGNYALATQLWGLTESVVDVYTDGVNFYNILLRPEDTVRINKKFSFSDPIIEKLYLRHVMPTQRDELDDLMNGVVKQQLGIIPETVSWGGQSDAVFNALAVDFMKPVTQTVVAVLDNTNLTVAVISGQLDLIVDNLGTMEWVKNLQWSQIASFLDTNKQAIPITNDPVAGFVKTFNDLSYYWVLSSGHMFPTDAGETSLKMVEMITKRNNVPF